jgi:hypothetical protein
MWQSIDVASGLIRKHVMEHFGDVMKRIQEGVMLDRGEFLAMGIIWSCEVGNGATTLAIGGPPRRCGAHTRIIYCRIPTISLTQLHLFPCPWAPCVAEVLVGVGPCT